MSTTRNFDNHVIIERLQNQTYARNLYTNNTEGIKLINNPQNSDGNSSRFVTYIPGAQTEYFKGLVGGAVTVSIGGTVAIPPFPVPTVKVYIPESPTIISITPGNQELVVYFTPGYNGGAEITGYQYSIDDGFTFTDATTIESPIVISGLTNGTSYQVVIRAVNSVGTGNDSNMVSATPMTVPSKPTITQIDSSNQTLMVYFTQPDSDGGSPITDYWYSINDGASYVSANTTLSPIPISGLTNGITYQVRILALNTVGIGEPSDMVTGIPSTIPEPPADLSAIPGNNRATINFTPGDNGGSLITNYQFSINDGESFTAFNPPTGPVSSVIIMGLSNGSSYDIKLKAINVNGVSSASTKITVTVGLPPNPPTITLGVGGNQAIYILFIPGADNGNAITNYQYSIDGGPFIAFSPAQTISPLLISGIGLVNNTPYNVQLKAVNLAGASNPSSTVSVTPIVTTLLGTNRLINLDSTNNSSYSGSGTTWTNLDSGGLYSATLNGSPSYNTTDVNNKYFQFNSSGSNQFAQIAQAAAINPSIGNPFTIQIWVRINNIGTGGGLVSKVFYSGSYDGYAIDYMASSPPTSDKSLRLHENGNTQIYFWNSTPNVLVNGWALYTANIQFGSAGGRTNKLFVNGRQVLTQTSNEVGINTPTAPLQFPNGYNGFGNCDIGAFYYYNTELSVTQIIQNFDATKPRYGV